MAARAIVNYGVYQFTEEQRSQRVIRVTTQVEKRPDTLYENFKYQKPVGFYGYAQFMIQDWVCFSIQIENEYQLILDWSNEHIQDLINHTCTRYSVSVDIADAITQLGGAIIVAPFIPVVGEPMPYDRVVFKLYSNTTLLVEVTTEPFINICDAPVQLPFDVPAVSEPSSRDIPSNSLDAPFDIPDAPYDLPSSDNGETYNPQIPEPPLGEENRPYQVTTNARYIASIDAGSTAENPQTYTVDGPVSGGEKKHSVSVSGSSTSLEIWIEIRYSSGLVAKSSLATYVGSLSSAQVQELISGYIILEVTVTPL